MTNKGVMVKFCCYIYFSLLPVFLFAQVMPVRDAAVAAGFLTITPDAVSGALGNTGTGGGCNVFSLYHNPAKYTFAENDRGVSVFYNPWNTSYAKNLGLSGGTFFQRWKRNVFSFGFRYFSYGSMDLTDEDAVVTGHVQPYELAADLAYSLQLSSSWSGSVGFKYIYSYLGRLSFDGNGSEEKGAGAYAFDVAFFYRNTPAMNRGSHLKWSMGVRVENIGSKLVYQKEENGYFLPAKLRVGGMIGYRIRSHTVSLSGDIEKLLIPRDGQTGVQRSGSIVNNIGKSFRGFSWNDLAIGVGLAYAFQEYFQFRCGYHYEDHAFGNQRFLSFGCGGALHDFHLDFAYLCYTGKISTLNDMLKIACGYYF